MENTKTNVNDYNDLELIEWLETNSVMTYEEMSEKQISRKMMIQMIDEKMAKFD